jgi:sirohydrochlorin ferrochelatase
MVVADVPEERRVSMTEHTGSSRGSGPGEMFSIAAELCRLAAWFQFEGRDEISVRLLRNAEWFLKLRAGHGRLQLDSVRFH